MSTHAALLLALSACGAPVNQQAEKPGPVQAAPAPPPAPAPQGLAGWPSGGNITCRLAIGTDMVAAYAVAIAPTSRVATVDFTDAFTGGHYTGAATYGLAEINSQDFFVRRNADYGAIGVYEADFGKGATRWWGFSLDIRTLILGANNAINDQVPPIDAGPTLAGTSADCTYAP